jgi:lipopolysaccharide export system protein LptA
MEVGTCRVLPGTRNAVGRTVGGARVIYLSRPRLACDGGIRIDADSMVTFEATGFNQLIGNVFFEDQTRRLISANARYFDQVGRLEADGDVSLTDKDSGNVVEGQNLLYLRAGYGRDQEELTVWGGRTHALLYPGSQEEAPDSAAPARRPYDVTANRIFLRGQAYVQASGEVEVLRDSLNAFADTLRYDQERERLLLDVDALVDQDAYDLSGNQILLVLPGDTIRQVEARGDGHLLGEELDLEAPFIRLGFTAGALNGLWASPLHPGQELEMTSGFRTLPAVLDSADTRRPEARSTDFHIVADSLEVDAPEEKLQELFAVGSARAVSTARDSLNTPETPEIIRRDWMEGDTVVAFFDEAESSGSDSTTYVLRQLEARGTAASLYRMEPDSAAAEEAEPDTVAGVTEEEPPGVDPEQAAEPEAGEEETMVLTRGLEPAVHYVTAEVIVIFFLDGQVDRMEVRGLKQGIHLDPTGRTRGIVAQGDGGGP